MSTIQTVNTITELKNLVPPVYIPVQPPLPTPEEAEPVVYVKGYYDVNDDGGGLFVYKQLLNNPYEYFEDLGIHFKPNNTNATGIWIRQYHGHINAAYFGVVKFTTLHPNQYGPPVGTPTNAERIQAAIDYTSSPHLPHDNQRAGDLTIYFPDGYYFIESSITLRKETHIKGNTGTKFRVNNNPENPFFDYMFLIEEGILSNLLVENIQIDLAGGLNNVTTGGFYFSANSLKITRPPLGALHLAQCATSRLWARQVTAYFWKAEIILLKTNYA